ncbi:hypothetical protein ASE04_18465 [Rhizobium sp. Root708]|uniref:hypothetical protein n=1 Tax=Rhizobium sp. Root708 TaxID=1736592 RepID=UPI0006FF8F9D|nr:hypothetical protein [Rhizobium sp. Root708]KRB49165.1 hypothetical protein ASE04_18465 [Rhizobium sp. Root708]
MKSQDIVVLLKLLSLQEQGLTKGPDQLRSDAPGGEPYSVRNLEALLGKSKTEIAQSLKRSVACSIARKDNGKNEVRPHRRNQFGFITNGLKFVLPAHVGSMQRGVPTAFTAPMLEGLLISGGTYNYVWPFAEGKEMGQSVVFSKDVPLAAMRDEHLYEYLALVDAIRFGNQREASLAADQLRSRILSK